MVRTLLLALALMSVAVPPSVGAAPPRNRNVPPSPTQLRWEIIAYQRGARVFRVHDVAPTLDALKVAAATVGRR